MSKPLRRAIRTTSALVVALLLLVVALPILAVWLPLWIFARFVRAIHDRLEPAATPWSELIEFDPELGWRTAPHLNAAARADSVFRFSTDGDGWRRTHPLAESEVVVLGDSFAFGFGVDDRAHFANVETSGQVRVTAMGAVAYNLVQELLLLERCGPALAGKLVVWMVYVGNDISENLSPHLGKYRIPFLREGHGPDEWEVVTSHLKPEPWPWYTGDAVEAVAHAELCCDTASTRRSYAATRYVLARGRDVCVRNGARLVVLGVPDPLDFDVAGLRALAPDLESFDSDRPSRQLCAFCEDLAIQYVDVREHVSRRDYKPADNHWNEAGHRRIAELVQSLARSTTTPRRPHRRTDRDAETHGHYSDV